jgi:hypothetical protein
MKFDPVDVISVMGLDVDETTLAIENICNT